MTTLEAFLQADELDELSQLANDLPPLDTADRAVVAELLEKWDTPQAIANLLMHPYLIPEEIRKDTLLRGLNESMTYNTLAAVIGLQKATDGWSESERAALVERLVVITFSARSLIANRASFTMLNYIHPEEADKLLFFLGAPEDVVRHNALLGLVRIFGVDETRAQIKAANGDARFTEHGNEYGLTHLDRVAQEDMPLLDYIPNLSEYRS